jgi:integrase
MSGEQARERGAGEMATGVTAAIAAWRGGGVSEAAQAFARRVVAQAAPAGPRRARALLLAAARLAAFGESVGLQARAEVMLHASVIERFIVVGSDGVSAASRRTLRSNLRYLARCAGPPSGPTPVALPRERAKPPYTDAQVGGYLALAAAQPTPARRHHTGALVCLGAGAGLVGAELRHLTGHDVVERSGGLLVVVGGRRARTVPVLERFHAPLQQAAAWAGDRYLVGGRDPDRNNLTDALTARLCADAGLPRLQAGRLRATWLVTCAREIGLGAFMHAAGLTCSQRLGDLIVHLPSVEEPELVGLLGGGGG